MVSTVMFAPAGVWTIPKVRFSSVTLHIIQVDVVFSRAKARTLRDRDGIATVKLSAHHVAAVHAEVVIADCPPFAVVVNFNPAGASVPSRYQSQLWNFWI